MTEDLEQRAQEMLKKHRYLAVPAIVEVFALLSERTRERDEVKQRLEEVYVKDRCKTREINILVPEVKAAIARAEAAESRLAKVEQWWREESHAIKATLGLMAGGGPLPEEVRSVKERLTQAEGILERIIYASDGCVGHRDCNHSIEPWKDARRFMGLEHDA